MLHKSLSILLIPLAAAAQAPRPAFEVASVKPATALGPLGRRADRRGGPGTRDPGTYICQNCPVRWVLDEAYDLHPWQYVGPAWVDDVRYDFEAKVPAGTSKEVFETMLQTLLEDRFRLAVHREQKEMQVYELTVARNGPKFHESVPQDASQADDGSSGPLKRDKDGFPILTAGTSMAVVPGHARIRSENQPISWFVQMLSGQLQSPVQDATGLQRKYDFVVSWAFGEDSDSGALAPHEDTYHPALIEAVQSQLGLGLEKKKGHAAVLVVDRIDKTPSGN